MLKFGGTGTIRSNLDPFSQFDDARLWDALRRSYLIEPESADPAPDKEHNKTRYTLDSIVEGDGANLSVGERSLLSLAMALVKDSKVVGKPFQNLTRYNSADIFAVLDEAT